MKYTVSYNWDRELIDRVDNPEVVSIYAGVGSGVIGGGRAPIVIKDVNEATIKEAIKAAHDKGWEFDFTLNAGCTANKEFTAKGHKEIVNYLEWVCGLGVDSVTITLPSLISIVKRYFPKLKVKVSTFQRVSSVPVAKRFEDMGVDTIMITEHCNRDFKLLRSIREAVSCDLALIANVGCIHYCPNAHSHINNTAHSAMLGGCNSIFEAAPNVADCLGIRLKNPEELVKSCFIRPEDVSVYEDIGIDLLKIVDRHTKTDVLVDRVKAYADRSFDGNMLYLMGQIAERQTDDFNMQAVEKIFAGGEEAQKKTGEFFSHFTETISDLFYLDNKKIPADFLKGFENRDCFRLSCEKCGYCGKIADIAMTVAPQERVDGFLKSMNKLKEKVVDGSILY